jgi:hypothetical protein
MESTPGDQTEGAPGGCHPGISRTSAHVLGRSHGIVRGALHAGVTACQAETSLSAQEAEEEPGPEYATVLLRMLVSRSGRLVQGEVISLEEEVLGRFRDWDEAVSVIRSWLRIRRRTS